METDRFITISTSDPKYDRIIKGEKINGFVALPINSFGTREKLSISNVTFELRKENSVFHLINFDFFIHTSRIIWLPLIIIPFLHMLLNMQKSLNTVQTLSSIGTLVFLFLGIFFLNHYFNHLNFSHKNFYNLKPHLKKIVISPLKLKTISIVFIAIGFLFSLIMAKLDYYKYITLLMFLVFNIGAYYLLKKKLKMNVSNLLAFFYCGPFILILTTWYFSFELTYDDLITYSTYGLLAMWVVTVKHFHQIMNDSKLEILTLPVKLGFDGSKNLLFWFPVFIFSLTLMKFINNDFESIFMLLIIFVTLIFTSIQVLKIDSTASSTFNRYPKIVLISYFIVAFLLMGVDFIWW